MGKARVGIKAAWIGFGGLILAAFISVLGKGCGPDPAEQSMEVKGSPASNNTQVTGNYSRQEMSNSPGAFQVAGDFYVSMPQKETRPYLSIELRPGPREYLKKDGNSQLYLVCCHNNSFLVLPFQISNAGKIHATHVAAEYSSPDQKNVSIELGEKSHFLASGEKIPETFRPHINISSIAQGSYDKEFNVELLIRYRKYDESDSIIYNSKFEMVLKETEIDGFPKVYKILKSELIFGPNEMQAMTR